MADTPSPNYEDDWPARNGERRQAVADQVNHGHDTDRYNGMLMRTDPLLSRLLKAYSKLDQAGRDELIRVAEAAASASGWAT